MLVLLLGWRTVFVEGFTTVTFSLSKENESSLASSSIITSLSKSLSMVPAARLWRREQQGTTINDGSIICIPICVLCDTKSFNLSRLYTFTYSN